MERKYERLFSFAKSIAGKVNSYIFHNLRGDPQFLYEAALHIIKAGGKRMRPAILMASGLMLDGAEEELIPYAASVELIHTFTLIHDDIMDNDEYRRNVKTVHMIWGVPTAIVAGDLLFSKSFEIPLSGKPIRNPSKHIKAVYELSRATSIVAEGQAMDMSFENKEEVGEKEYLEMIYKKTAALIEASAVTGAIIAEAPQADVERLREYGRKIGLAFQIKDDILGIYGKEEITGKPVYSDFKEGKKTLLVIKALEKADPGEKRALKKVLGNRDLPRREYEKAAEIIESLGVKEEVEEKAHRMVDEAITLLKELESSVKEDYRQVLIELARYTVEREK